MLTKPKLILFTVIASLIVLSLLFTGCQPKEPEIQTTIETVVVEKEVEVIKTVIVEKGKCETLDKAFFALDWVVFGRHTPYYVALEQGFFLDQCIDITMERGFGSVDTVRRVYSDQADFGFADMSAVVLSDANEGFDTKIVYMVYANGAPSVHFLQDKGIAVPTDLVGKKIAGGAQSSITAMLPGFLKVNRMDISEVDLVTVDVTTLNQLLLSRQVDAILEFPFNNVSLTKLGAEQGLVPDYFLYAENNFPLYANGIVARQKLIDENPDLVARFVKAIEEGLKWSFENPEEAVKIMRKYHPEIEEDVALGELEIVKRLAVDSAIEQNGYGYMDPEKVTSTVDLIAEYIGLKGTVTPGQVYTNEFIPGTKP